MATEERWIRELNRSGPDGAALVGGKGRALQKLVGLGRLVPSGFVLTTEAYRAFVEASGLRPVIDMEVLRKDMDEMRWEEIWDASLRIQNAFLRASLPDEMGRRIEERLTGFGPDARFAVRSSAPAEDALHRSFAGIHDSVVGVAAGEVADAVRTVMASLWSDRALLYRHETSLDAYDSAMAVVVQEMALRDVSGILFTANPATRDARELVVEVIEGTLDALVDNRTEPERFRLAKDSGRVLARTQGGQALLDDEDLMRLWNEARALEEAFGYALDVEWTGRKDELTFLQARPVTTLVSGDTNEERLWYLSLTPPPGELIALADEVEGRLIPGLKSVGERFEREAVAYRSLDRDALLARIEEVGALRDHWKDVYWERFIPFAHGIRQFGRFYNERMRPDDPYEFVNLLSDTGMLAGQREEAIERLAREVRNRPGMGEQLQALLDDPNEEQARKALRGLDPSFEVRLDRLLQTHFSQVMEGKSLRGQWRLVLRTLLSREDEPRPREGHRADVEALRRRYEQRNADRPQEAATWLRIGRLSWRLRDDDNILLGRLEAELHSALHQAVVRYAPERSEANLSLDAWRETVRALRASGRVPQALFTAPDGGQVPAGGSGFRQLVGQPSSPGTARGTARVIRGVEDMQQVRKGEILVFDALSPQMTFVVPLAAAIVERRGGMLVHSSIIARERGIPAVNGVPRATERIRTGDRISVNGDLGVVVIGV